MSDDPMTVSCPNCGARVIWNETSKWRPFCSERCKMIDLGEWIEGNRAIAGSDDESGPSAEGED